MFLQLSERLLRFRNRRQDSYHIPELWGIWMEAVKKETYSKVKQTKRLSISVPVYGFVLFQNFSCPQIWYAEACISLKILFPVLHSWSSRFHHVDLQFFNPVFTNSAVHAVILVSSNITSTLKLLEPQLEVWWFSVVALSVIASYTNVTFKKRTHLHWHPGTYKN